MNVKLFSSVLILCFGTLLNSTFSFGQTSALYFEGTPGSVSNGNGTLSSADGYTIVDNTDFQNADGIVNFFIDTTNPIKDYYVDFATANSALLEPGLYTEATRYPFNFSPSGNTNGLDFFGNSVGYNTLAGEFDVIEVEYSPTDVITSLAADFIQTGDGNSAFQDYGSIRYNSEVPLDILDDVPTSLPDPEPSTWALFTESLGLLTFWTFLRRSNS